MLKRFIIINMVSEYCKICKLFDTCEKSKNCSCDDFITDISMKAERKQKQI